MKVDERIFSGFPYAPPFSALPWHTIADGDQMPLNEWVWVGDYGYNVYPAVRTERGVEVPEGQDFKTRVAMGILGPPRIWLPLVPKRRIHVHLGGAQGDGHA